MMRKLQNPEPKTPKQTSMEPMAEGIATTSRGREWSRVSKEEIVAHAKKFISENGIGGRAELKMAESGLYEALKRRKLLDEVGLPDLNENDRDWTGMSKKELIAHSKKFIAENKIVGRKELKKADRGLYNALRKRKLLDEVGLGDSRGERRDWAGMGKKELVAHAKKFIAENKIEGRKKLAKEDKGLYNALCKRKLLDAVFSGIESEKRKEAVMGVIDTLESFGDGE